MCRKVLEHVGIKDIYCSNECGEIVKIKLSNQQEQTMSKMFFNNTETTYSYNGLVTTPQTQQYDSTNVGMMRFVNKQRK